MNIAAETAKSDYSYWQNALAGNFLPIHDGDAQPGFYRKRTGKSAGYVPVAIWRQGNDGMICLVDQKPADPANEWSFVADKPITEEQYRARVETGKWWDEDAAVTASLAPPAAGHNNPPTDEAEVLKGQIDAATAGAGEYAHIGDDETAAKAQSLRSRLLELSGQADKIREAQKKPHLEAGKAIDAKFQPLVKTAKAAADLIRDALGAHETRKAREAERIRREQEEAARKAAAEAAKAAEEGKPAPVVPAPQPIEPIPAPAANIRGAYGRAAAVKLVKVARVIDQDAAYQGLKTHKELVDLIAILAQRAATAGITLPGVEVTEERKVS